MIDKLVTRYTSRQNYIQMSTRNREYEGKTDNHGGMLYLGYAVYGVCCTQC